MKATQFFLFMGPKLWSFRRGETEYGVRLYPLGAFVRIIGMNNMDEVAPEDEPRAYRNKSYPRRMLVICAGSMMHMIIAISLLFGVYAVKGQLASTGDVVVSEVVAGGPAEAGGMRSDDLVRSIDGVAVTSSADYIAKVQQRSPGDMVTVVVERDGVEQTLEVGLGSNPNQGPTFGKAFMGTRTGELTGWESMSIVEAAQNSVTDLGTASATNSFVLTGSGLSTSVELTVPSGFEVSTDNGTTFVSNSTLTPRPSGYLSNNIAVRLAGSSAGIFGGNITAASGGTNAAVAVTGREHRVDDRNRRQRAELRVAQRRVDRQAGHRGGDEVLALGRVRRGDVAHHGGVQHRAAARSVEHHQTAVDRCLWRREVDAAHRTRPNFGQTEQT
jgi:membrane-associated protease RseP (regulator of RpoE activity)